MRILVLCLLAVSFGSCQKESFTTETAARLSLFTDTLRFDTVFTRTGSITRSFKVFNNNNKGIRIQSIRLGGGAASPFRINVNGESGPFIGNLELPAGDSAYFFVSVNINPTSGQQPFVVQDSVEIMYNGNRQVVHLQAYGQHARFMRHRTIAADEVWNSDLPYVVLERLEVGPGATLTIEAGTRIYVHATAPIIINGRLVVQGSADSASRVRFSGDRLDAPYRNYPGAWPGIRFGAGSHGNKLQYAVLQNAYQAIVLEGSPAGGMASLDVSETIIDGAYDAGIFSQGGQITGTNLLVSNCGKGLVLAGGQYLFAHCTIAGYPTPYLLRKEPLVQAGNLSLSNGTVLAAPLDAVFRNCIIWGEAADIKTEVALSPTAGFQFSAQFDHVLWKAEAPPGGATVTAAITEAPQFQAVQGTYFNFRLQPASPAVNKGAASAVAIDLDGAARPIGAPDLGAYEVH